MHFIAARYCVASKSRQIPPLPRLLRFAYHRYVPHKPHNDDSRIFWWYFPGVWAAVGHVCNDHCTRPNSHNHLGGGRIHMALFAAVVFLGVAADYPAGRIHDCRGRGIDFHSGNLDLRSAATSTLLCCPAARPAHSGNVKVKMTNGTDLAPCRKHSGISSIGYCAKPKMACRMCRTIRASPRTSTFWRMCLGLASASWPVHFQSSTFWPIRFVVGWHGFSATANAVFLFHSIGGKRSPPTRSHCSIAGGAGHNRTARRQFQLPADQRHSSAMHHPAAHLLEHHSVQCVRYQQSNALVLCGGEPFAGVGPVAAQPIPNVRDHAVIEHRHHRGRWPAGIFGGRRIVELI